jgi:hypothetical protein
MLCVIYAPAEFAKFLREELARRSQQHDVQANGSDQPADRGTQRIIVVNDKDDRLLAGSLGAHQRNLEGMPFQRTLPKIPSYRSHSTAGKSFY